jgi:hypothetical protein
VTCEHGGTEADGLDGERGEGEMVEEGIHGGPGTFVGGHAESAFGLKVIGEGVGKSLQKTQVQQKFLDAARAQGASEQRAPCSKSQQGCRRYTGVRPR